METWEIPAPDARSTAEMPPVEVAPEAEIVLEGRTTPTRAAIVAASGRLSTIASPTG